MIKELSKRLISNFCRRQESRMETIKKSLWSATPITLGLLTALSFSNLSWLLITQFTLIWLIFVATVAYAILRIKILNRARRLFGVVNLGPEVTLYVGPR